MIPLLIGAAEVIADLVVPFAVGAAIGGAATAAFYHITGIIDLKEILNGMREKGIKRAMIRKINKSKNQINLEDLDTGVICDIQGEGIDDNLYEGQAIYI